MIAHKDPNFLMYFGDATDKLMPAFYLNLPPDKPLLEIEPFSALKTSMGINILLFLHQIHSDHGEIVDKDTLATLKPFKNNGDFLITQVPYVGLGVMTGDCLPIILYDAVHKRVAVVHAGWRGSVQGIAVKTIETMYEAFGTKAQDIEAFFGPAAKICCYKVGVEFKEHLEGFAHRNQVLTEKAGDLYFDLPKFNEIQLEAAGVKKESIHHEYNICTICDHSFYSYRREGENAGRQMTVVSLR